MDTNSRHACAELAIKIHDNMPTEISHYLGLLKYVEQLEELLDETNQEDFFGTSGWRNRI